MDGAMRLRICLLGELTASFDGAPLDLGGRRQRAVLAILLLARGEVVPAERVAAVFPGEADSGWPNFGPADDERTARRAYDEATLRRIVEVSRTYDPDGVLQVGSYTRAVRQPVAAH